VPAAAAAFGDDAGLPSLPDVEEAAGAVAAASFAPKPPFALRAP